MNKNEKTYKQKKWKWKKVQKKKFAATINEKLIKFHHKTKRRKRKKIE